MIYILRGQLVQNPLRERHLQTTIVPSLRGTITAYGDTRVADLAELPDGAWFLRGERGVTYSTALPEGSRITDGAWWPADYAGPPLVSLDRDAARVMGVGVGDTLTVSVLGGVWLFALGVVWWVGPTIPEFEVLGVGFGPELPAQGWVTGLGVITSALVAWGLIVYSIKRWRGDPHAPGLDDRGLDDTPSTDEQTLA